MKLSEQLPMHSADPETWNRLSAKLDALDAEAVYQDKLQQLPVHAPDQGLWASINSRLNRAAYFKIGTRVALSAAAGLLLFFTVSKVAENYTGSHSVPKGNLVENPNSVTKKSNPTSQAKALASEPGKTVAIQNPNLTNSQTESSSQRTVKISSPDSPDRTLATELLPTAKNAVITTAGNPDSVAGVLIPLVMFPDAEIALNNIPESDKNIPDSLTLNKSLQEPDISGNETANRSVLFKSSEKPVILNTLPLSVSAKTNPSQDPGMNSKKNRFALAMGYLPETMSNGTDNSLFHNVDLTASYNKEKVRFTTSVGMAYNEDQYEIAMSYDIKSPVTAFGPRGNLDTLSYNSASLASDFVGSEKHQYFTYNLGFGRRIFGFGKFSTWINAGAGFGIRLNNPDLVVSTENSIKNQSNAKITNFTTSKPVYNDVNVNFVTGIDFNYKILNRLSFTFTPTSRWYFKPVLSKNNQATDELTLGFKTGMKFDF